MILISGTKSRRGVALPSVPAVDADWAKVVLMLGFETAGSPTEFLDESLSAHALTVNGGAFPDTSDFKFGATSYKGNGTDSYLTVEDGPGSPSNRFTDFDFRTGDFTIEMWLKTTDTSNNYLLGRATSGTSRFFMALDNGTGAVFFNHPSLGNLIGTSSVRDGVWRHVAACRASGTMRIFANGVEEATDSTSFDVTAGGNRLLVGTDSGAPVGRNHNGWLDELRITKGVARYTGNFTPPTAAFPRTA